jgi:hypothetical protein
VKRQKGLTFLEHVSTAADVDPSVAALVIDTAVDYIEPHRPDLTSRLDALMRDADWCERAAALIGRLGRSCRPIINPTPRLPTEES